MKSHSLVKKASKGINQYFFGGYARERGYFKEEDSPENRVEGKISKAWQSIFHSQTTYYALGKALPDVISGLGAFALYQFRDYDYSIIFLLSIACGETIRYGFETMFHHNSKRKPSKLQRREPEAVVVVDDPEEETFLKIDWQGKTHSLTDRVKNLDEPTNRFTNN